MNRPFRPDLFDRLLNPTRRMFLQSAAATATVGLATSGTARPAQAFAFEPAFPAHHLMHGANKFGLASLCNLDKLVGRGRFRFIGFPLKIKGGTGSPIRAVALFE